MRKLHILLVENHTDTRRWIRLYLEELGHFVVEASTLKEAQASLDSSEPEVLIIDIGLPDGTGVELLEQIRGARTVFAITMSGFGMATDGVRSREAGGRQHLLKPFKVAELDKLLEQAAAAVSTNDQTTTQG